MSLLKVDRIAKSYGERELFSNITFTLDEGWKVALVARNGTGKTSLINILAGLEEPDSGQVEWHPNCRFGYLPQEPDLPEHATVLEAIFASDIPQVQALREYERLVSLAKTGPELERAMSRMEELEAWDFEARVKQVLGQLQIHQFESLVSDLSGGEKKRVALAKVLLEEPDLLILDEPTNHLDLAMIEWLEEFLSTRRQALLMVTHDRYFLDRVCNEILELDAGELYRYRGNYGYYLEKKDERVEQRARSVGRARSLLKTEMEWLNRMPKARGTKSKSRVDSVLKLREFARQKVKEDPMSIDLQTERLGSKILELHNVGKSYGDRVMIEQVDYKFRRRERLGIVGPNGAGKTTLLRLFTGEIKPDAGKVVIGETVKIGYYTQEGASVPEDMKVIEAVREVAEYLPMWGGKKLYAGQLLEQFLFDRKKQYQHIRTLSGGERRRLDLLLVLMTNPNFLILDEPTNDLDILTLNVLEDFLLGWEGCLVIVSHDRYFMDKLVEHLFVLDGRGGFRDFPGSYSDYREAAAEEEAAARKEAAEARALAQRLHTKPGTDSPEKAKTKLSYKEKREFEQLESDIEALENRKAEIEQEMGAGGLSHEAMHALSEDFGKVLTELEQKSDRWLELSEFA